MRDYGLSHLLSLTSSHVNYDTNLFTRVIYYIKTIYYMMKNIHIYETDYVFSDKNTYISKSSIDILAEAFKNIHFDDFFKRLRNSDKSNDIIIDIENGKLAQSPMNDLPLISKMLLTIVKHECGIQMIFDKQFLTRIYCSVNDIKYNEYTVMYKIASSKSAIIKSFTIIKEDELLYLDGHTFKSKDDIEKYVRKNIMIFPIDTIVIKETTNYPLENMTIGEFINKTFINSSDLYKRDGVITWMD